MNSYLLAFDLGTTGNKAVLVHADSGQVAASATAAYATRYTAGGGAEQSPEDWWQSAIACCKRLSVDAPDAFRRIAAIGCGGMMNGVVLVDENGFAVRDAIIHADTRSDPQCRALEVLVGRESIFRETANRLDPHLTLPKLCWLRDHEPDILKKTAFVVQAKDYLVGRLTGVTGITDPSDASLTGGFNVATRRWVPSLWDAAGIRSDLLPRIALSTEVVGRVTAAASSALDLMDGIPVVAGGGDGACASAGSGAASGTAYNYLGGTSWIGLIRDAALFDDRLSNYCCLDERVTIFGTVQAAGSSVEWVSSLFGTEGRDPARLDDEARLIAPGSDRLFFLPYLQGERSPLWDAQARGVFFGLSSHHARAHLFRATLEGVAYALRSIADVFAENGELLPGLRVLGGGAKSALWREILAGVLNRPLSVVEENSGATSLGAAFAAGVGVGVYPSLADASNLVATSDAQGPSLELVAPYEQAYAFYRTLYPLFKERFAALAEL